MVDVSKKSLVDEAYEKIRQKICDFEMLPGQSISDFKLCKELNMSRTPIRQALQKIEDDGLIRHDGMGTGYTVCDITPEEIVDLFDARISIELNCIELAFKRGILKEDITSLIYFNEKMNEANLKDKMKQQFLYDQKFHDKLVYLSHNTRLIKFNDSLLLQFNRMRVLSYLERSYQQKAYDDHSCIIKHIQEYELDYVLKALREHIESTKANYISLLKDKEKMESFGVLSILMKSGS